MLSTYDYVIIAVYLVFMLSLGLLFKRLSRNTSDYFRCGGGMPWWITGTSAWIASFSAWTFVGAAGQVYKSGYLVLPVFLASIPALIIVFAITCVRFRRLRVVTWMEAVRERFGPGTEQFYTWLKVPIQLFSSAMGLMAISVLMSAVFKVPVWQVQIVLGIVITFVAFAGGAFAVLASDFVQMILVMTITLVTVFLTVRKPEIGGLTGLFEQLHQKHPNHLYWWNSGSLPILVAYCIAFTWVKTTEQNNFENATMYLMPKSDTHARRMVLIPIVGGIVGPLIWTIPPLAAALLFTNADLIEFTGGLLKNPSEAAFVKMATDVMPIGLLGLLLCAMFGATLTSMDAGLNKCVGVFVRSFYRPVLKPAASETHLLRAGKICTLTFGAIIIVVSVIVGLLRTQDLFTFMNQVGVSLGIPLALPLLFGLFYRRTPPWSAWVTALLCFGVSFWANFIFSSQIAGPEFIPDLPPWIHAALGNPHETLSTDEQSQLLLTVTAASCTAVGLISFFGSSLFYKTSAPAFRQQVDALFNKLKVPVQPANDSAISDEPLYRLLGTLCIVYGMFVLLLMAIPNALVGRLCFLFIGGIILTGGLTLYLIANKKRRQAALHQLPTESPTLQRS